MDTRLLGKRVRAARGDLSLREFAKKCEISHTHLDSIEKGIDPRTGKSVIVSIDTLEKLASGIGCSIEYLLGNSIGRRIKNRRLSCGLTLTETAQRTGIQEATIEKYESGEIEVIPIKHIEIFASVFDTTIAYLMFLINDPDSSLDYKDLIKKHIQMEADIAKETQNAIDAALAERKKADQRLISTAHKICFRTPESGVDNPIGLCNAKRIDVITDFILGNEKYLRVLLAAADESQGNESEHSDDSEEKMLDKQALTAIHELLDLEAKSINSDNQKQEQSPSK